MAGVKGQRSGGHNKKSVELHLLRGTFRKDRHGARPDGADLSAKSSLAAKSETPSVKPTPRKPLKGEAKDEWDRVVADLEEVGGLALIDGGRLYQYVNLFAEVEGIYESAETTQALIKKARKALNGLEGMDLLQAVEQVVKLQQLAVRQTNQLRQGRMAVRQYLNDLGLTPVARHGKVGQAPLAKPKSTMDRYKDVG